MTTTTAAYAPQWRIATRRSQVPGRRRSPRSVRARVAEAFREMGNGVDASAAYQRTRRWWRARSGYPS